MLSVYCYIFLKNDENCDNKFGFEMVLLYVCIVWVVLDRESIFLYIVLYKDDIFFILDIM